MYKQYPPFFDPMIISEGFIERIPVVPEPPGKTQFGRQQLKQRFFGWNSFTPLEPCKERILWPSIRMHIRDKC